MLFGDAVNETQVWIKRTAVGTKVHSQRVRQLLNESAKLLFPKMIASELSYWIKRVAFTGTSITLPADFLAVVNVECTDVDCTSGHAFELKSREVSELLKSSDYAPSNADPAYVLNATTITVYPTRSGFLYYIYAIPSFTDDTTDVDTVIPYVWQDPWILKAAELARIYTTKEITATTQAESGLKLVEIAQQAVNKMFKPLNIVEQETTTPPIIFAPRPQQQGGAQA